MVLEVRQKVRDILFDNAVNVLAEQPHTVGITRLLCMASYKVYNIERMLGRWFDDDKEYSDMLYNTVGKVRHPRGLWGRPRVHCSADRDSAPSKHWPFVWFGHDSYNVYYTPIANHCDYNDVVKCIADTSHDGATADIPAHRLLYKDDPAVRTIWWQSESNRISDTTPVELSTLYYEKSDRLISELTNVLTKDESIANDVGRYRAIYHTPIKNHVPIIQYLERRMFVLHGGHMSDKIDYIRLAYWLLSQAVLFERGSASIVHMVCCVLWRWIGMKGVLTTVDGKDANMEAMLSTSPEMWELVYPNVITTRKSTHADGMPIDVNRWLNRSFFCDASRPMTSIHDIEYSLCVDSTE